MRTINAFSLISALYLVAACDSTRFLETGIAEKPQPPASNAGDDPAQPAKTVLTETPDLLPPVQVAPLVITEEVLTHSYYPQAYPDSTVIPVEIRDFRKSHRDFQDYDHRGIAAGLVEDRLSPEGLPVYNARADGKDTNGIRLITSAETFADWYHDVPGVNQKFVQNLELRKLAGGKYGLDDDQFFPLDHVAGLDKDGYDHNFHFTVKIDTEFTYRGGEEFWFKGDDDVWVFINERLAVDLGGTHLEEKGSVLLDQIKVSHGLEIGKRYHLTIFYAERFATDSHFRMETTIEIENLNKAFVYLVKTNAEPGRRLSFNLINAPAHMTIDGASGQIIWPEDKIVVGEHKISVQVTDDQGQATTKDLTLNVVKEDVAGIK